MPLHWDIGSVEDWEAKKEKHHVLLDILIMSDLTVQMSGIPKDQVDEVYFRYRMLEKVGMTFIIAKGEDGERVHRNPTREEIEMWAGLTTNVSALKRPSWNKDFIRRVTEDLTREIRTEESKREENAA